jgi:outer membrane protein OmpA-like peptidoglycan-associated protein
MTPSFRTSPLRLALSILPLLAAGGCAPYNTTLERITQLETRQTQQEQLLAGTRQDLEAVKSTAGMALAEAQASEKRNLGRVVETITLSNDRYLFPFNTLELEKADTTLLDELGGRLKTRGRDYQLIIQGHTEDIGSAEHNYLLGEGRANAVRRYLHVRHGIPLQRMSAVSYGATEPLVKDPTVDGKANRRVILQVTE